MSGPASIEDLQAAYGRLSVASKAADRCDEQINHGINHRLAAVSTELPAHQEESISGDPDAYTEALVEHAQLQRLALS